MGTLVIDNWTIISILIPILVMTILGLFMVMMDYKTELDRTKKELELIEEWYHEYRHKYCKLYEETKKRRGGVEEE